MNTITSFIKIVAVCLTWVAFVFWMSYICEYDWTTHEMPSWLINKHQNLKYILISSSDKVNPLSYLIQGQDEFIARNCSVNNCFITTNAKYFQDIRDFDAIIFLGLLNKEIMPKKRSQRQIYIFYSMESSPNNPLENKLFDGFFNRTATYRLDSDIPLPYLLIKDKDGNIVGPKTEMHWVPDDKVDDATASDDIFRHKSLTAAIFYSNCRSLSGREELVKELQVALKNFGLTVEVFGECGPYSCPKSDSVKCNDMLARQYYFYLSYENSLDVDYVTEKLLRPLQHNVIPIVYGGANYSRFLPPRSYLDASKMTTWDLVQKMVDLMRCREKYLQYFWWKKYYTYYDTTKQENLCKICEAIVDSKLRKTRRTDDNFINWWDLQGL